MSAYAVSQVLNLTTDALLVKGIPEPHLKAGLCEEAADVGPEVCG